MTGVFKRAKEQFVCRSCAATHVPAATKTLPNICEYCWEKFSRWIKDEEKSEHNFTRWLARSLYLNAVRMHRYGTTGRCEATTRGPRGWLDGFGDQCRGEAVELRDGRRLCAQHANATRVVFIDQRSNDPYHALTRVMTALAKADPMFRRCLEEALGAREQDVNRSLQRRSTVYSNASLETPAASEQVAVGTTERRSGE